MRRIMVLTLIVLAIFTFPSICSNSMDSSLAAQSNDIRVLDYGHTSSASGSNTTSVRSYFTREISGLNLIISNTYKNLNHLKDLNLSAYQISGWSLSGVDMVATSIDAIAERATMGITPGNNDYIKIWNDTATYLTTNALYQAFYGKSQNGKLENYSFIYRSDYYDISNGVASLGVRGTYNDTATNITGWITPWIQAPLARQVATHDCSGDNAILDANTYYYVVIDGTTMVGVPGTFYFNNVWWSASKAVTGLATGYHLFGYPMSTWFSFTGLQLAEAMLNYTYTPWNKTSNAPLSFTKAEQISLHGNGTSLSGMIWNFSSSNDIGLITFQSNQSVAVSYNIVLHYQKDDTASTAWKVDSTGAIVQWNVSFVLDYPAVSGLITRYANITIQSDWTPTGLYNSTSISYDHYVKTGALVLCTDMTNGSWILTNEGFNYVTSIDLSNLLDGKPIPDKVSILVDINVSISVEDEIGTKMNSGTVNLTVWHGGSVIYAPSNESVLGGAASYTWNIDSIADYSGNHIIEVYWTNGTEAGYLVTQVFVYYPTTLVADEYGVSAFTDNTFPIGVDFTQDYPVKGLDSPAAELTYTFESGNISMVNEGGGRWTASVDTSSMSSGFYNLTVYAIGYAIENRSIVISVHLTHQTQVLNWSWSPSNSMEYLGSTNLTAFYREIDGTNITGAWVNVTFQGQTYNLTWDSVGKYYWIELYGVNFTGIPGSIPLNVSAWKVGYEPQYNDTLTIDVLSQTGVTFAVDWGDLDIKFIEQATINVTYSYNSAPISGATVTIMIGTNGPFALVFNSSINMWQITINGSDYLGTNSVTIQAISGTYETKGDSSTLIVRKDVPTLDNSWTGSATSTDYDTDVPLTITVQDSSQAPINDAIITITINGAPITYAPGEYTVSITPPQTRGAYQVNVTMVRYGYNTTSIFLTLTVRATTELQITVLNHEYEQWYLTATANYTNERDDAPVINATVIMTLNGVDYTLQYQNTSRVYTAEILLDIAPGSYTLDFSATATLFNPQSTSRPFAIDSKRAVTLVLVSEGDPSEGQLVSLRATLTYNDTGDFVVGRNVVFVVTVHFMNDTVLIMNDSSQFDTTNENGVATWSFRVPAGTIDSIQAEAYYSQSRDLWGARNTITVTAGINPLMVILRFFFIDNIGRLITISMIGLGVVVAAYNRKVKPRKRLAMASLENQLQMFVDLESLRHFMAVYLDRGTCVFYHPFTDERIQPDLISGFIAAITSVYGEIKGDGVRGTLEEIQYHGLRLNSYSGEKIIGILILEGEMTPLLKDRLQFFVELFENQYEKDLEGWTGLVDCFDREWIVSTLNHAFNYSWLLPHRLGQTQKVSKTDAKILDYIAAVRDERGEFNLRKLLSPLAEMLGLTEAQVLDRLLTLQDRGAIVPVNVQTVLQRQGMGLSEGQIGEDMVFISQPPTPEAEERAEEEHKPAAKKKRAPPVEETIEEPATPEKKTAEEEVVEEPVHEVEPEEEVDPLEAFVKDVESLLTAKEKDETDTENNDDE